MTLAKPSSSALTAAFLALIALPAAIAAAGLQPATAAAFDRYVRLTEQRINEEVAKTEGFLWIDTLPKARAAEVSGGLKQGGVIIERLETRDGSKEIDAPGRAHPSLGRHGVRSARGGQRSCRADAGLRPPRAIFRAGDCAGEAAGARRQPVPRRASLLRQEDHQRDHGHRKRSGIFPARRDACPQPHPQHSRHRDCGCGNAAGTTEAGQPKKTASCGISTPIGASPSATAALTSSASR